jgi:hypothetical protein
MSDAPPPQFTPAPTPAYAAPQQVVARRPAPVMAILALALGALLVVLYLIVKLVGAVLTNDDTAFDTGSPIYDLTTVLGILGILAILPAAVVVVLGHIGVRRRADGTYSGRLVAAAALAVGYLLVLMWGNRLLVTFLVASSAGDFSTFVTNNFWWA